MSRKPRYDDTYQWWHPELPEGYFWRIGPDRALKNDTWREVQLRARNTGIRRLLGKSHPIALGVHVPNHRAGIAYAMITLKHNYRTMDRMHRPFSMEQASMNIQLESFVFVQSQDLEHVEQWVNQA